MPDIRPCREVEDNCETVAQSVIAAVYHHLVDTVVVEGPSMSSAEVCRELGISYRRLHWLTVAGLVPERTAGSGVPLRWSLDTVERLRVALALERAASLTTSQWPAIVSATMAGPEPPTRGWAVLADGGGQVAYAERLDQLPELIRGAAVVAQLA